MTFTARRVLCLGVVVALLGCVAPQPASASPETLKRSIQNLLFAPLDLVLSPYVATRAVWDQWNYSEDTTAVKVAYPIPGLVWQNCVQLGASTIRAITGAIELLPGLGLAFVEADLDPLYDLPEDQEAVVDVETAVLNIRFGVNYVFATY